MIDILCLQIAHCNQLEILFANAHLDVYKRQVYDEIFDENFLS